MYAAAVTCLKVVFSGDKPHGPVIPHIGHTSESSSTPISRPAPGPGKVCKLQIPRPHSSERWQLCRSSGAQASEFLTRAPKGFW